MYVKSADLLRGALVLVFAGATASAGCAAPVAPPARVPAVALVEGDGAAVDAGALAARTPLTLLIFFSRHCSCFTQHEPRLRALDAAYRPRGVQIVAVDSEVGASPAEDTEEATRRGLPFPILVDPGAKLASALGARYATYSVVVDREGRVVYAGGLDSDKTHLHDDAAMYVREALDDLLAGRPPRTASAKALGCALETW
jgi:peroxiredoxin